MGSFIYKHPKKGFMPIPLGTWLVILVKLEPSNISAHSSGQLIPYVPLELNKLRLFGFSPKLNKPLTGQNQLSIKHIIDGLSQKLSLSHQRVPLKDTKHSRSNLSIDSTVVPELPQIW